jgi:DNA-binding MarR family transcriptional regulator
MTATADQPDPGVEIFDAALETIDLTQQLTELLTCSSWRLRRAARRELEPLGLTFGQARALRLLARAGGPMRIGELAARLEVVPRSATTMVDALETAGLAGRQAAPDDRRSVLVSLTTDGEALLERLGRARRAGAEELFARLTAPQRAQLFELLTVLNRRDAEPADGAAGPARGPVVDPSAGPGAPA